jgi:hypothetical protein
MKPSLSTVLACLALGFSVLPNKLWVSNAQPER